MGKRKATSEQSSSGTTENFNSKICDALLEIGEYEKNINRQIYKYQAYRKAAATLARHPTKIKSGAEALKLEGIGQKIAEKIDELLKSGHLTKLEKIRADDTTIAVNELIKISGIGPVQAKKLYDEGIKTIEDLKKHADKLNHHQQIGLKYYEQFLQRIPRSEMENLEKIVEENLKNLDENYTAIVCGSYRRGMTTSGDIDILLTHKKYVDSSDKDKSKQMLNNVVEKLKNQHFITDVISQGDSKFMGVCKLPDDSNSIEDKADCVGPLKPSTSSSNFHGKHSHRRIDIRLVPENEYWCCVLYFTGSDEFNRQMRHKALEEGFTINEYAIRKLSSTGKPGEALPVQCEKDIFDYISMEYAEPKDRCL